MLIKVLSISPPSSSTSTVEILSSHGTCPPEDDANMFTWSDEVRTLRTGSYAEKQKVLQKISEALNYKMVLPVSEIYLAGGGRGRNVNGSGMGNGRGKEEVIIPLTSFDPDRFDIDSCFHNRSRTQDFCRWSLAPLGASPGASDGFATGWATALAYALSKPSENGLFG